MALVDGKWVNMRVPYPLGFFAKWIDGRIDDPNGGWKGRGLWTKEGNRTPLHGETNQGNPPKNDNVQLCPHTLRHQYPDNLGFSNFPPPLSFRNARPLVPGGRRF